MNRRSKTLLISMFILLCWSIVQAGDIPESLMSGEQQALFIGELVDLNEETSSIQPLSVMMGEVTSEVITINPIKSYYGTSDTPAVGDYLVIVLLTENEIDHNWLFKATSSDYQTLNLISEEYDMVKRYEKYINDGDYFAAQNKIEKASNELKDIESPSEDVYQVSTDDVKLMDEVDIEDARMPKNQLIIPLTVLILCLAFIAKNTIRKRR